MVSYARILKFSLQSAMFSLCMAMRILFSMFWIEIFIFRVLKCDVVNFVKYSLAGMNGMSISNFWLPCLHRGGWLACMHALAQCMHDVTADAVTHGMTKALFSLRRNKLHPTFHVSSSW